MKSFPHQWLSEIGACLRLAIPLAAAQLSEAAIGFIDTVVMGWLGSQNLAAGGLASITFNALLIASTGMLSAVGALAAIAYGAGDLQELRRIVSGGIWLTIALSLFLMILLGNFAPIFRILGQEEMNSFLAQQYLQAILWGLPAAFAFAFFKNLVSALNRPHIIMVTMVSGISINALGNYVLAFGKWGFPELGLVGLAWASAFAFWVKAIAVVAFIAFHSNFRQFKLFHNGLRSHGSTLRALVKIGFPITATFFVEASLFTIVTYLMGQLGSIPLAAHQIALQTAVMTFMVCVGISYATAMRVGQMLGRKDFLGVRRAGYVGIALSSVFMSLMAFLFWLFPEQIVAIYLDVNNPNNQETLELAIALLSMAAIFQIFDGIQVTVAAALRGIKDTRVPLCIGIFSYWAIGLGGGYLFGMVLGWASMGLWWGLVCGLGAAAAMLTYRFRTLALAPL
ncbi:MAG: MATE family efflux transporter [Cyanobacteria bacterium SBLK]|nr:MATE family efflux transporter [Cyanobacteria bacterium SBLK]